MAPPPPSPVSDERFLLPEAAVGWRYLGTLRVVAEAGGAGAAATALLGDSSSAVVGSLDPDPDPSPSPLPSACLPSRIESANPLDFGVGTFSDASDPATETLRLGSLLLS